MYIFTKWVYEYGREAQQPLCGGANRWHSSKHDHDSHQQAPMSNPDARLLSHECPHPFCVLYGASLHQSFTHAQEYLSLFQGAEQETKANPLVYMVFACKAALQCIPRIEEDMAVIGLLMCCGRHCCQGLLNCFTKATLGGFLLYCMCASETKANIWHQ